MDIPPERHPEHIALAEGSVSPGTKYEVLEVGFTSRLASMIQANIERSFLYFTSLALGLEKVYTTLVVLLPLDPLFLISQYGHPA